MPSSPDCPEAPRDASLRLSRLVVPVRLGWTDAERAEPQPVAVDLEIRFAAPPAACRSDELAGTVDYGVLARCVAEVAAASEVRLVEFLGQALYDALCVRLPAGASLAVTVTKRPPLAGVEGSASFRLGDWR